MAQLIEAMIKTNASYLQISNIEIKRVGNTFVVRQTTLKVFCQVTEVTFPC